MAPLFPCPIDTVDFEYAIWEVIPQVCEKCGGVDECVDVCAWCSQPPPHDHCRCDDYRWCEECWEWMDECVCVCELCLCTGSSCVC